MARLSADEQVHQPLVDPDSASLGSLHDDDALALPLVTFTTAGSIVYFLTFSAGISGLLFGYDTGVISSTLVCIGSDLSQRPLTTTDQSIITAVTATVALFLAPATAWFADEYGRKFVIWVPALLFIGGAVLQAFSSFVWVMVLGRALVGAAIGLASGAVPLYITELAPAELRGTLVTIQALFITGGQVVAYVVGWGLSFVPHGWRWMVGLGAVPAAIQLCLLVWMPETPRWLLQHKRGREARAVLEKVYTNLPDETRERMVEQTCLSIEEEIAATTKTTTLSSNSPPPISPSATHALFHTPSNRRALAIACLLQGLQQLCGFNALMYFSATLLQRLSFTSPLATALLVAGTNFLFTLLATYSIDRLGRRASLLYSIPIMCLSLAACGITLQLLHPSLQTPSSLPHPLDWRHILFLTSLILYVAAYATGLGCVPWQQSELFPLPVRSLGSSLATTVNWTGNFVVGVSFLPMLDVFGPGGTFALYTGVCALGWGLIYRIYPETAGLRLEDVGTLLRDGWGVKGSLVAFRARRARREGAGGEEEEEEDDG